MKEQFADIKHPVYPMINTIVSCRDNKGKDNALAVGFVANIGNEPRMTVIGIRPERYSYHMIKETECFVINIPTKKFAKELSYLGTVSGYDEDKLANINTEDAKIVNAPILTDCPVNIECLVVDTFNVGSHVGFVGKVENIQVDEEYVDENGNIQWNKIDIII